MSIAEYLRVMADHEATPKMKWGALAEALRCICEGLGLDVDYDPVAPPRKLVTRKWWQRGEQLENHIETTEQTEKKGGV